jgi:GTP-binding protein HflX
VLVSGATGEGVEPLVERVVHEFDSRLRTVELLLPYDAGGHLAELHELAGDLKRDDTPEGVRVSVRLAPSVAARYSRYALSSGPV